MTNEIRKKKFEIKTLKIDLVFVIWALTFTRMWNPFSKKDEEESKADDLAGMPGMPDTKDMNMLQRFAMKRLMSMSPADREKALRKAMTPKNIEKHKGEILASLEAMRKAGQMSDDQYRLAKARFGLK